MDLFSLPPISFTLDAAYSLLMGVVSLLQPIAGGASAAVAVILITMLVRALLIPTGIAQAKADQSRARIAPRLRAVQKRYKNDPQRMRREIAALHAEENVSPAAGCLPVLIQAPVVGTIYALFLHTVIAGHPNVLLTEQVFGVPLGASLVGFIADSSLTVSAVIVFGVVVVTIAAVAELTRRMLGPQMLSDSTAPGGSGALRTIGVLQFATAVAALFVPLAAGLYLMVTAAWTLVQRLLLRRRFRVDPAGR